MTSILFDGNESNIRNRCIEFIGKQEYLSPSYLVENSVLLSNNDKSLIDRIEKSTKTNLAWVNFGFYRGSLGLPVYSYSLNHKKLIFEFGEYQPGRYILNQLAIIEE